MRARTCEACKPPLLRDGTLEQAEYAKAHRSSAFSYVRALARRALESGECAACGYSKHTEVCHIRPIRDFPITALISEVNDPSNLIRLCPNCHWEFDHGLISPLGVEPRVTA